MPSLQETLASNPSRIGLGAVVLIAVGLGAYLLGAHESAPAPTPEVQATIPGNNDLNPAAPAPSNGQRPIGHMKLEAQFYGPLKSTVIQRWRDDESGMLCYIYLPIIVPHSKPLPNGLVYYGSNTLGTISCR